LQEAQRDINDHNKLKAHTIRMFHTYVQEDLSLAIRSNTERTPPDAKLVRSIDSCVSEE
jgi:hypothetical protein